jgi:hypothetical protein
MKIAFRFEWRYRPGPTVAAFVMAFCRFYFFKLPEKLFESDSKLKVDARGSEALRGPQVVFMPKLVAHEQYKEEGDA